MNLAHEMTLYLEAFLRLIYPASCNLCDSPLDLEKSLLCSDCENRLHASRFHLSERLLNIPGSYVDEAWALYPYASPLKELLLQVKLWKKRALLKLFDGEISAWAATLHAERVYDLLIPVPMERRKIVRREFNQAQVLAKQISRQTAIPVEDSVLFKRRPVQIQRLLTRRARFKNLENAFAVRWAKKIQGRKILLIDDVLTTGATSSEIAKTLKSHGAIRVDTLVLAYTDKIIP